MDQDVIVKAIAFFVQLRPLQPYLRSMEYVPPAVTQGTDLQLAGRLGRQHDPLRAGHWRALNFLQHNIRRHDTWASGAIYERMSLSDY